MRLVPLAVTINGSPGGSWLLLESDGRLHATQDAFEEWRLNLRPDAEPLRHRNQLFYPLAAVPGFQARINAANQSVDLQFSPSAFAATRLTQAPEERPPISTPATALFLNYDLSQTSTRLKGAGSVSDTGGLFELGTSGAVGVLTSTQIARRQSGAGAAGDLSSSTRLETTFTRDFPDRNLTLRLGDSSTRSGSWGRSVYFGGVQLGRNFSLNPGLITQPLPVLTGLSSGASTVELYVNDALRQTSQVPSGPFAIDNFPLMTGAGQARVVVRDLLGRETVLVQNFLASSELLDTGLSDWSAELGAVRRGLGTRSNEYSQGFASGLLRLGLSKAVTLEAHGEASRSLMGAGLGLVAALPGQILGQAALAASRDDERGRGHLWLLGLEYSTLRHNLTFRIEGASRDYRQLGQDSAFPTSKQQVALSYTYGRDTGSFFGLGFARIEAHDRDPLNTYTANYSLRLGQRASLSVSATRLSGSSDGKAFGLTILVPLDTQLTWSGSATHREGQTDAYVAASRSPLGELGTGWRVLAGRRGGEVGGELGWLRQGSRGQLTVDSSFSSPQQTVRLGAQGGVVVMDGSIFATRRVQDSFALVEVPGHAEVGVGFQSQVQTRTDANGRALVSRLLPYRSNSIRLDPSELPISAELDSIEQTVVPPARSGVKVVFPVRSGRGALIRIVFDDGQPAPAGADVELVGDKQSFFTARRGEAFVTGLKPENRLRLKWNGQVCEFPLSLPPGNPDDIARVDPIVCRGVKR